MNARVYFSVLRPVRSIALGLFYGGITAHGTMLFGALPADRTFAILTLGLPIGLGAFLAGSLHEPLHRDFALWLPDLRRRFRAWHLGTLLVLGLLLLIANALVLPDTPLATAAGLIAVGLTLPLLNSRRRIWGRLVAVAVALAVGAYLHAVRAGLSAFPIATLTVGIALTVLQVRIAFDADRVRRRATNPFICVLSIFSSPKMAAVQRRHAMRASADRGRQERVRVFPAVTGSLRSWMTTVWRAQKMDARTVFSVTLPLLFVLALAFPLLMAAGLTAFLNGHGTPGATVLDAISVMGRLNPTGAAERSSCVLLFITPVCLLVAAAGPGLPAIRFPIARERLARVEFGMLATSVATAAAVWVVGTCLLIAGALQLQHEPVGLGDFRAIAGIFLVAPPFVPLVFATRLIRAPFRRMLTMIFAGTAALGLTLLLIIFQASWFFSGAGLAVCLVGTAATTWVGWRWTQAHWRKADLAPTN